MKEEQCQDCFELSFLISKRDLESEELPLPENSKKILLIIHICMMLTFDMVMNISYIVQWDQISSRIFRLLDSTPHIHCELTS